MIKDRFLIAFIFNLFFISVCNSQDVTYLDNNYPGLEPKIYAPNILSLPDRFEHGLSIRNQGSEHIFGFDGSKNWSYNGLISLKRIKNNLLVADTLDFTGNMMLKNKALIAGEPNFSSDYRVLYFVADYPTDIWKVLIDAKGNWGKPVKLDTTINSEGSEWFPIISQDNCLYFARDINGKVVIHKAELVNGEYKNASIFEAAFNYDCGDQVFSKNMDYIIFGSPRQGGFGNMDLYIAFKRVNGEWTDGINMGSEINTDGFELAPYISPDNKYLFFTRRDKINDATASDIYWVNLDVVSKCKQQLP